MEALLTEGQIGILAVAGLAAGAVNAVAGGGSLISFPALMATGMSPVAANVTNSVATVPGYLGGCLGYRSELRGEGALDVPLAVASVVGAIGGSALLLVTPPTVFRGLAPWFVIAASALLAAQPALVRWTRPSADSRGHRPVAVVAQTFVGIYGGYFAAGLGILMLSVLSLSVAGDTHRLNAHKGALSLLVGLVSSLWFAAFGPVHWVAVGVLAASGLAGGFVGVGIARRVSQRTLRLIVVSAGFGSGAALMF